MSQNDVKRIFILNYAFGAVIFVVSFWGIWGLGIPIWSSYSVFKAFFVFLYFGMGYLVQRRKIDSIISLDISCNAMYLYGFIGTLFFHSTYVFAFYEGLALCCFFYNGPLKKYVAQVCFGLVLAIISLQYMPEPDFVKEGSSIRSHLQATTAVFGVLSILIYWLFNRQRELIYQKDKKFASIGRQSAFLLHELKSPLSRFMMGHSENDNRDAKHILSIVESVEMLITRKENLQFNSFSWSELRVYLETEFYDICQHYKIELAVEGFEGNGFGHESTLRLALRNLVKNAIEAISLERSPGKVRVLKRGNEVWVQNNGPLISKEMIKNIFEPFQTNKSPDTNMGIGLHFVENVVKAHNGSITIVCQDGWTIFKMVLGSFS